jgi:glycosyltransferase involved in cell wall biosynthesis
MRILIATTADKNWMGGVPTYVRNLERGLQKEGVDVVTFDVPFVNDTVKDKYYKISLNDYIKHILDIYSFRHMHGLIYLSAVRSFCEILKKRLGEFDLIHAQDPFIGVLLNHKREGIPLVITVHGLNYEHSSEGFILQKGWKRILKLISGYHYLITKKIKYYEYLGLKRADHLICVDTNHALKIIRNGISASKITVIQNAVDIESIESLSIDERIYRSKTPYFLMLRRFSPKNGVEYGVRGFLHWVGEKNINLVLAGDGPLKNHLKDICLSNKNGQKVIFLGEVNHAKIPALIKNAIASIVPSVPAGGVEEATSLAALESLALGVPVIASNIGGLAEIDDRKGILCLVPPGSVDKIALEMEHIYQAFILNSINRERLKAHVLSNYDTSIWIKKIVEVYEKVINKNNISRSKV